MDKGEVTTLDVDDDFHSHSASGCGNRVEILKGGRLVSLVVLAKQPKQTTFLQRELLHQAPNLPAGWALAGSSA
jgi:hypothetical protein